MKKQCAVFTIVRNEWFFLPIWLRYFQQHFEPQDIYILDNQSDDNSTLNLSCNVRLVVNELYFDHPWLVSQVKLMQGELLRKYDYVIFCEVDELVIADPRRFSGLRQYVSALKRDSVRCVGYEIVHLPERESPIDLSQPIFPQRHFWYPSPAFYSKPAFSNCVLEYCLGFHNAQNCHFQDEGLIMVHVHKLDYQYCLARHKWKLTQRFKDDGPGVGWHHHISEADFDSWYYANGLLEGVDNATAIPEWIKGAV